MLVVLPTVPINKLYLTCILSYLILSKATCYDKLIIDSICITLHTEWRIKTVLYLHQR